DLEAEQRRADRHVVGGGDTRGGAGGDEEPLVVGRDLEALGEVAAGGGAALDERALAAERGAHADGDDRDDAADQRAAEGEMARLDPDRLDDAGGAVAAERAAEGEGDQADEDAAGERDEDAVERRRDRARGVERGGAGLPHQGLDAAEEMDEEHGAEASG